MYVHIVQQKKVTHAVLKYETFKIKDYASLKLKSAETMQRSINDASDSANIIYGPMTHEFNQCQITCIAKILAT